MTLNQIEVYRDGQHVANFPISQLYKGDNQAVIKSLDFYSVPYNIQMGIYNQIQHGQRLGKLGNFQWNFKNDLDAATCPC